MRVSWLLFVVVSVFSIIVCLANAEDGSGRYLYHICSGANYTSNSIYQINLNTLLSSLSSDTNIDYGFYNVSEGEGIERVNSIALYRGDLSLTACRRCVNFSTIDLPQRCPNQKEAIVWYDNCMFRYLNKSIFYSMEDPVVYMWNVNNVSNVSTFTETLDGFLYSLRKNASSGDSRQKFAIGDTKYVAFTRIYSLVQCTPDLTELQCSNCLENSFRQFVNNYLGREGEFLGPAVISDLRSIDFMKSRHLHHLHHHHRLLLHHQHVIAYFVGIEAGATKFGTSLSVLFPQFAL